MTKHEQRVFFEPKTYNVLIIGAGRVSAFYDTPGSSAYLSHAHAFSNSEYFNLLGFYDVDYIQAKKAANRWDVDWYTEREYLNLIESGLVDVCCLCMPEEYRYDYLQYLSDKKIKFIFCEKPLVSNFNEAQQILKLYNQSEIPILMNYSRRFVPEFNEFKSLYETGELGKFLTGNGYYGKGFLHNGSHNYDFLRFVLGEIDNMTVFNLIDDYAQDDRSYSVVFGFEKVPDATFTLNACDERCFTIFEMDFLFEKCRVRISDIGKKIEYFFVRKNDVFSGYRFLEFESEKETAYMQYMKYAVEHIYRYLENEVPLKCSLEDGVRVMEIWNDVKNG